MPTKPGLITGRRHQHPPRPELGTGQGRPTGRLARGRSHWWSAFRRRSVRRPKGQRPGERWDHVGPALVYLADCHSTPVSVEPSIWCDGRGHGPRLPAACATHSRPTRHPELTKRVAGPRALLLKEGGSERRESNPRSQLGKLMYCLCTTLARPFDRPIMIAPTPADGDRRRGGAPPVLPGVGACCPLSVVGQQRKRVI